MSKKAILLKMSRYGFILFGGFFVDMLTAYSLLYVSGLPFFLCGIVGLAAGMVTNYIIVVRMTDTDDRLQFSWKSLRRFFRSRLLAGAVRVVLLFLLGVFSGFSGALNLILAAGTAYLIHAGLTRFYVFKEAESLTFPGK